MARPCGTLLSIVVAVIIIGVYMAPGVLLLSFALFGKSLRDTRKAPGENRVDFLTVCGIVTLLCSTSVTLLIGVTNIYRTVWSKMPPQPARDEWPLVTIAHLMAAICFLAAACLPRSWRPSGSDGAKVMRWILFGLALLLAIVGGWLTYRVRPKPNYADQVEELTQWGIDNPSGRHVTLVNPPSISNHPRRPYPGDRNSLE